MAQYQIDNVPAPLDFQTADTVKRVLQNAKNLLMCRIGEVPYDRYRGFDPALYDLPLGQMQTELLPELDRLMLWEPDAEVVEAQASMLPEGGTYINVIIDIPIREPDSGE